MTAAVLDHPITDTTPPLSLLVAAALVRVSRAKAADRDRERSPEQQTDAARGVTEVDGRPVLLTDDAIYEERMSASRFGTKLRKRFADLLDAIRAGRYQLVIAWEIDRISREMVAWSTFLAACRDHGVLIHVITHRRTYDVRVGRDWRALADDGVDAAYFSEKLSVNILRGHMDSVDRGRPGGQAPYGYTRDYEGKDLAFDAVTGLWAQVPNDDAPVVKEIIERVAAQVPLNQIERDLHARGIMLGRSTIRTIALRPAYAALRPAGDELKPGKWPAIVPEATWRKAVAVIDGQRDGSKPGRVVWLLSNVGSCVCGASESWKGRPGKDGRQAAYFCSVCGTKVNAEQADEHVMALALGRLARPDAAALLLTDDTSGQAAAAHAEAGRLKGKLKRNEDKLAAATDPDDEDTYEKEINRLKKAIKAATARAEKLSTPPALAGWADVLGNEDAVVERWAAASLPARKDVLRVLFERLELQRAAHRGQPAKERLTHRWAGEAS